MIDKNLQVLDDIKQVTKLRALGNFNNMLPLAVIIIPDSVVISCPMARQHLSQAKKCCSCSHFNGIVQTTFNDECEMQWDHKYAISCGFPVDRKCITVCIEGIK